MLIGDPPPNPIANPPLTNLVAWYRADAAETDEASELPIVTTWRDYTSNANDLHFGVVEGTDGDTECPRRDDSGSFPVVRWNGTAHVPLYTASGLYSGAAQRTIAIVFQADNNTGAKHLAGQMLAGVPQFTVIQNVDRVAVYGQTVVTEVAVAINTAYRYAIASYNGTRSRIVTKDGSNTRVEALTSASQPFFLAGTPGGTKFAGSVAECIVYNTELSAGDQTDLITYLTTKYGL